MRKKVIRQNFHCFQRMQYSSSLRLNCMRHASLEMVSFALTKWYTDREAVYVTFFIGGNVVSTLAKINVYSTLFFCCSLRSLSPIVHYTSIINHMAIFDVARSFHCECQYFSIKCIILLILCAFLFCGKRKFHTVTKISENVSSCEEKTRIRIKIRSE